jgi:transcriptional regulator with XRE-family HTH domain
MTGARVLSHLARVRILAGHSQRTLAIASGVSQRQIANLEAGKSARPHLDTARKIADALGVEVEVAFPGARP